MENEKAQNERLPEPYRSQVLRGVDCDEIAGPVGEFGRDPRNPIPVNGPLGELTYLSNLRTVDSQPIMFHRLGLLATLTFMRRLVSTARYGIFSFSIRSTRESRSARLLAME